MCALLVNAARAQLTLNRLPSREIGHPRIDPKTGILDTNNPNLVEGRELYSPISVAVDTTLSPPALYVADTGNNRVLGWRNATAFSNGSKADLVIGQKDFMSTVSGGPGRPVSTGFLLPGGLAVDQNGNLYVIDAFNNRILRFPQPFSQTQRFLFPDLVIGQSGLNCSTCNQPNSGGMSASTISVALRDASGGPVAFGGVMAFDPQGNLWLADSGNRRVLRYPASVLAPGGSNGPAADLVIGQVDFTTTPLNQPKTGPDKSSLGYPSGLAFDSGGRLYVSDSIFSNFGRVLVYAPPFFSGMAASRVLGQSPQPAQGQQPLPVPNEYSLSGAEAIFMIGDRPAVVDTQNNRIVIYDPFTQWPAEAAQPSPAAKTLIGQNTFRDTKANRAQPEASATSLAFPAQVVLAGNELFVADTGNHRVIVLPFTGSGQTSAATRVLGQDGFDTSAANLLEGREFFFSPGIFTSNVADGGVVVDVNSDTPHLYVADTGNNRILGFLDARKARPGDKADMVIGQPDFRRGVLNYPNNDAGKPTQQSLNQPVGLALDSSGNLYVADAGNGRVLRFPRPFDQQSEWIYPKADLVLGQSSFTSQIFDPTPLTMRHPYGLAFAGQNGLLVSDPGLSRVLLFRAKATDFTNGMAADKVFGQPDFTSFTTGNGDNQFNQPRHIATDSDDRLYLADEGGSRVMIFDRATDPLSTRAGTILQGLSSPRGIFVSLVTGEIWVAEAGQNRVLRFPKFDDLALQQNQPNLQINTSFCAALTQDSYGDLFTVESTNRIAMYFPSLKRVVNGAAPEFTLGQPLSPGSIGTLNTQGPPFTRSPVSAPSVPLPTDLGDVQVLISGQPVPLYYASPDQVNFQVPQATPAGASVELQVVKKSTGQIFGVGLVNMAPVSPSLFTVNGAGNGQLVAVNDDGTFNAPTTPIFRSKVLTVFGTGLGLIPGGPDDGNAASGPVPIDVKPRVFVEPAFLDDANIVYAGLTPGAVGVWQINFKIPDTVVPSSTVQVFVQVRSVPSVQPGQRTTIAVKQ